MTSPLSIEERYVQLFHQHPGCEIWLPGYIYGKQHPNGTRSGKKSGSVDWKTDVRNGKDGQQKPAFWSLNRFVNVFMDEVRAVGKSFGYATNFIALDIDTGSPCHPNNNRKLFKKLKAAIAEIEVPCCRFNPTTKQHEDDGWVSLAEWLTFRSSYSGGLHLFAFSPDLIKCYEAGHIIASVLKEHGFELGNGKLEIYPYKTSPDVLYRGIRIPCQPGSGGCLLINDQQVTDLVQVEQAILWARSRQYHFHPEKASEPSRPPAVALREGLPPISVTGYGETNNTLGKLANWGYEKAGIKTVAALAEWMKEMVPKIPGLLKYASEESKKDLEGNWCDRWAATKVTKAGRYGSKRCINEERIADTDNRLEVVVSQLNQTVQILFSSARKLKARLAAKGRELFGVGFCFEALDKRKDVWNHLLGKKREAKQLSTEIVTITPEFKYLEGDRNPPGERQQMTPDMQAYWAEVYAREGQMMGSPSAKRPSVPSAVVTQEPAATYGVDDKGEYVEGPPDVLCEAFGGRHKYPFSYHTKIYKDEFKGFWSRLRRLAT